MTGFTCLWIADYLRSRSTRPRAAQSRCCYSPDVLHDLLDGQHDVCFWSTFYFPRYVTERTLYPTILSHYIDALIDYPYAAAHTLLLLGRRSETHIYVFSSSRFQRIPPHVGR